jgi:hypothetical protein
MKNYIQKKHIAGGLFFGAIAYVIFRFFQYATGSGDFMPNRDLFREIIWFLFIGICFILVFHIWKNAVQNKLIHSHPVLKIAVAGLGTSILLVLMFFVLRLVFETLIGNERLATFFEGENPEWYKIAFVLSSIVAVSFHTVVEIRDKQKQQIAEQTFKAGTVSAELNALKSQLDPHFLFNSLNVLAGLIEENPEKAQDFTVGLSKVYRYVLEQKDKEWVPAQEELDFAKTYLQLLQMRFESSIQVDLPEQISRAAWKIVPLSLQLLLENAVKHNEASNQKPLRIRVFESEGTLVVENNLQPKENIGRSSGFGLENIKQRFELLTDKKIQIHQTEKTFTVTLPLLTEKKNIMQTKEMSQSYLNARKRVDDLKDFYGSLISFIIVIPILIFINYRTYWGFQWFWFPLLGWGLGLVFSAAKVYFPRSNWEQRKFQQFLDEERRKTNL